MPSSVRVGAQRIEAGPPQRPNSPGSKFPLFVGRVIKNKIAGPSRPDLIEQPAKYEWRFVPPLFRKNRVPKWPENAVHPKRPNCLGNIPSNNRHMLRIAAQIHPGGSGKNKAVLGRAFLRPKIRATCSIFFLEFTGTMGLWKSFQSILRVFLHL